MNVHGPWLRGSSCTQTSSASPNGARTSAIASGSSGPRISCLPTRATSARTSTEAKDLETGKENASKQTIVETPEPIAVSEKKRKMSFKEKQEFEQIEKMLPQLETEKEQLSSELSSGNLSNEQLLEKGARLGVVVDQIDEATLRWLELSELA